MDVPVTTNTIFIQSCIAKTLRAIPLTQILKDRSYLLNRETKMYYAGLPSGPPLLARSSSLTIPWEEPTGLEAYARRKELRPVGDHALSNGVWEKNYAPYVLRLLESQGVMYTSVDIVRIVYEELSRDTEVEEEPSAPVILWIGVIPKTLAPSEGLTMALMCKEYLEQNGITDVDVELRESFFTRSAGPKFLSPVSTYNQTAKVCRPLTCTLGLSICAETTSWLEGTGGFFMAQGGESDKILLVTARHVVLPPGIVANDTYEYTNTGQPRRNVLLLGDGAFKALLKSTEAAVEGAYCEIEFQQRRMKAFEGEGESIAAKRRCERAQRELVQAEGAVEKHIPFHQNVIAHWSNLDNRVIGHVVYSPPFGVGVGDEPYARDFAIIEMDASKFDGNNFKGNVIDLGAETGVAEFTRMIRPHLTEYKDFTYPFHRLLSLEGTIPQEEIRHPTTLDKDGDPCLMVFKRGAATDLTIGLSNNIPSFVRHYFDDKEPQTSMVWAILPRNDGRSSPFSKNGDSGAVIVDGLGRMGGLLTGGAGYVESSDITYATPIEFIQQCIVEKFPDAHLYPVVLT